jgi:hypothetical protein
MSETRTVPVIKLAGAGQVRGLLVSPSLAVSAAVVAVGSVFFRFIWKYSVNIFFWDQWDWLTPFFHHSPGLRELFFEQWGPHREGVALIADKALYALTSWNTRAESFMIGACIFVAMLLALVLKRKLFGSLTYSDLAIPLTFLTLSQWETMVGTPNPAHSAFPLLMIMLYCIALLQSNRTLRYGLVLLLNFLLIYTGFGVFMGIITIGVFALETYWCWRRTPWQIVLPLAAFVIASASLGSFFVHYTFWPAVDCFVFPYHPITSYLWFMGGMFWEFIGPAHFQLIGTIVGPLMLLFALAAFGVQVRHLLLRQHPPATALVGAVLLGFSLLFAMNTAVGRICLGRQAGMTPRYMTLLIPAFLAIYFYLLSFSSLRAGKLALGLFVVLLIPSAVVARKGPLWSPASVAAGKRAWAKCYLETEDIHYCDNSASFKIVPHPEDNHLKEKLDYLKQHRLNLFDQPTTN